METIIDTIKNFTLPTLSFVLGAIILVVAIIQNVSIRGATVSLKGWQPVMFGLLGIIFLGIGFYGHFFPPSNPTPAPTSTMQTPQINPSASPTLSNIFFYVQDNTGKTLANAQVTLDLPGQLSLSYISTADGLVRLEFDSSYIDKTAQLIVEASGFKKHFQFLDLKPGGLPFTIVLEKE